ncbi:MAG: TetR/AcrR family transcriptional regulator, partial [Nitrospirota bacterium]|nr:TetR/AcrR family transcriptional regulator [Nitrospirota bacterium]
RMEESSIDFLVKSMWIVSIFWLSFLETGDEEITVSRLEEGIDMMRNLLRPYLRGTPPGC